MENYRHPLLKRDYGMYFLKRDPMERRFRRDTAYHQRVDRTIHIYAYIMILRSDIKEKRNIKAIRTFRTLPIFLI